MRAVAVRHRRAEPDANRRRRLRQLVAPLVGGGLPARAGGRPRAQRRHPAARQPHVPRGAARGRHRRLATGCGLGAARGDRLRGVDAGVGEQRRRQLQLARQDLPRAVAQLHARPLPAHHQRERHRGPGAGGVRGRRDRVLRHHHDRPQKTAPQGPVGLLRLPLRRQRRVRHGHAQVRLRKPDLRSGVEGPQRPPCPHLEQCRRVLPQRVPRASRPHSLRRVGARDVHAYA
mmetsp:Transcript_49314/g.152224  ORF Transcript_49314/g.152224 Transcript_49314/m.152224 type:complete len:231 (+) Transcript_49314:143-835(+)